MEDICKECERTVSQLADENIDFPYESDYCNECFAKLMKEWQEEQDSLNRWFYSTRL